MLGQASRAFFHILASNSTLKQLASRYGMRRADSFARRFVAGETIDEAIEAARALEAAGLTHTLDYLGEAVATMAEADAATRAYLAILERIVVSDIGRNISLKLTQLGLTIDRATSVDNLRRILDAASSRDFFLRIDMEDSPYTQLTFDIFDTIWQQGYRNAGVVVQSYLRRTPDDVRRLNAMGARVRLVKGAYKEPRTIAYQKKSEVDAAFVDVMQMLLADGVYPAIATHDPAMIAATRAFAASHKVAPDAYEFQMLYGIRRDLQSQLRNAGYRVRVYVPFGHEWFPYFMRRLGERPANVGFVIRGIAGER